MFANRDSKLRFLKIMRDIERNLAGYLTVVTIINAAVGIIVARRRLARRFAQSGDLRTIGGVVELRALYRPGRHGGRPVRRRPGHVSLARATRSSRRSG